MALTGADLGYQTPHEARSRSNSSAFQSSPNDSGDKFEPFDPRGALNRRRAPSSSSIASNSPRGSSLASSSASIAIPGVKKVHKLQALSVCDTATGGIAVSGSLSEDASTLSPSDQGLRSPTLRKSYDEMLDDRKRQTTAPLTAEPTSMNEPAKSSSRSKTTSSYSGLSDAQNASLSPPRGRHLNRSTSRSSGGDSYFGRAESTASSFSSVRSPAAAFLSGFASPSKSGGETDDATDVDPDDETEVAGWQIGRTLGVGAFSVVRECFKIATGEPAAVKVIKHQQVVQDEDEEDATPKDLYPPLSPGLPFQFDVSPGGNRNRANSTPVPFSSVEHGSTSFAAAVQTLNASKMHVDNGAGKLSQPQYDAYLDKEISVWSKLPPHPHVVPLMAVHKTKFATYVFMPKCDGGNLLQYLNDFGAADGRLFSPAASRSRRSYSTATASSVTPKGLPLSLSKHIFSQVAAGLAHVHGQQVTHRDVKLENILLGGGKFMLADFGLAVAGREETEDKEGHHHRERSAPVSMSGFEAAMDEEARSPAGSLNYCSPEQLRQVSPVLAYGVDIWALGCVLYALLEGRLPFNNGFEPKLRLIIQKGDWSLPRVINAGNPSEQKNALLELLQGCLCVDPEQRWTIKQVLESTWLVQDWPEVDLPSSASPHRRPQSRCRDPSRSRSRSRPAPPKDGNEADAESDVPFPRAPSRSASRSASRSRSRSSLRSFDSQLQPIEPIDETDRGRRMQRADSYGV